MKRREARRQREREQLPQTLLALVRLVSNSVDTRAFFDSHYGAPHASGSSDAPEAENATAAITDSVIVGEGLQKLIEHLGDDCPDGAMDLLRVVRRVPRSQSTLACIHVAELCFAVSQASGPVGVHERRRAAAAQAAALDENTPMLQYYKGVRFRAMVKAGDHSVTASAAAADGAHPTAYPEDDEATATEWKSFLASAGTALPMTLRIHNSEPTLKAAAESMLTQNANGVVKPVEALPLESRLYSCSNKDYHADPRVEYVCRTLHAASAASFQEVVSALPVLVLGIEPQHKVLDMCAAPGSKTLQGLDAMLSDGWDASRLRRGVFIANEKDRVKATQTLPARLKRFHAPCVMCTRCDAVQWPRLFVTEGGALSLYAEDEKCNSPIEQRFDRIICDVPCSGDGTLRKEPSVAATWSATYVNSLVPTQKSLLRRGLDLLENDGVLVYSTCSLNPKEDEEVVCAALELFGDAVELLDVNAILARRGAHLCSHGGVVSPDVDGLMEPVLPPQFDGRKVLRVLPHRDDTGGFFVAAFRKVKQLDNTPPTVVRNKLNQWTKGKLWAPVAADDPAWTSIAAFYGFDRSDRASFSYYPQSSTDGSGEGLVPLFHLNPNGGPTRRIVFATPALASMVLGTRPFKGPGVELVSVGVRAFELYDGKFLANAACRWRAVVESASFLASRFTKRKLLLNAGRHHGLVEELLRNGWVPLRDHWETVLGASDTAIADERALPFVRDGPLKDLLRERSTWPLSVESRARVDELLPSEVQVGGVLVALSHGHHGAEETPWYVSATLSGNKLELAVDASLRAYGLMVYLNIHENPNKIYAEPQPAVVVDSVATE